MTDQTPTPDTTTDGEQGGGPETGAGYVFGQTFDVRPVIYAIDAGLAMFEGDIVLGTVEQMAERTALVEGPAAARLAGLASDEPHVLSSVSIPAGEARWPDGVVPYEFDPALPEAQRTAATDAVAHWNTHSRLCMVARDATNAAEFADFLRYSLGGGCSSSVGRQGGAQIVSLGSGCFFGQAVHETGHSIGLWHEQSREDRDHFVRIAFENVEEAQRHNFDQHITDGDDVGPYDYGSIMHYPATAFSTNGQPTIVPLQPNVTIGQRSALSAGDRAGVRAMYPQLEPSNANTWVGDFTGDGQADLLYYLRSRRTWYLGSWAAGSLAWTQVGETGGFGQVGDGRPFWVGDFDGDGADELLCYFPGAGDWWLGDVSGTQLTWSMVGNTQKQFGQVFDGRPFYPGRFSGADATELLFYSPTDHNWWLGSWSGTGLSWTFAGNTEGGANRLFWVGDFGADGQDILLMYVPGDGNWWEGMYSAGQLQWWQVGNTLGAARTAAATAAPPGTGILAQIQTLQSQLRAGAAERGPLVRQILTRRAELASVRRQDDLTAAQPPTTWPNLGQVADGRPFYLGRFSQTDRIEVLFYSPGDSNWWLGTLGDELAWTFAGNTLSIGKLTDGRPLWVGDFDGDGRDDLLMYAPAEGVWWVAAHTDGQLKWAPAGTTPTFGNVADGRPTWTGSFNRKGQDQLFSYLSADGHCWLGGYDGTTLGWTLAATFEA